MRLIFALLFIIISLSAIGQVSKKFAGTWEVIAMSGDGFYYNMKTDSISIKDFGNEDSVTVDTAMVTALIRYTLSTLNSEIGVGHYTFLKNGSFVETTNGKVDGEGTYSVDPKGSLLILKGKRNGVLFTDEMSFKFEGNHLILRYLDSEDNHAITLEKQK